LGGWGMIGKSAREKDATSGFYKNHGSPIKERPSKKQTCRENSKNLKMVVPLFGTIALDHCPTQPEDPLQGNS